MFSYRSLTFLGLVICIASMLFAVLYLERTLFLDPCPLCILDRVVIISLGVLFSLAFLHGPITIFTKIVCEISCDDSFTSSSFEGVS